ncbi:MAG: flagellar basal body L-ring protein FlgH [Gammaproteobacteria bacterium]|nr:flagellar basal body L-ring protein FlgH [Gammaproteobacteria bacterium]
MKILIPILVALLAITQSATAAAQSLYSEDSYQALVSDQRSNMVGQSLTVLIFEEASSSTSAGADTNRSTGFSASTNDNVKNNNVGIELNADTEGGGTINRNGKLIASVTVTISKSLDNDEYAIAGEQLIEFNEEKQHIRLSGRVRKDDISAQNTVLSTRIADAKITYIGDGLLGRRQEEGHLSRFFNWLF